MKKTFIIAILIAGLLSSVCSAEILQTALGLGTEKFAVQGFYSSTPIKNTDSSVSVFGPRVIYGVTDDFDVMAKLGMGSVAGLSASIFGVGAKFTLLKEVNKDPLDLAAMVGIDTTSAKDLSWGTTTFGVILSKYIKNNFSIYGPIGVVLNSIKYTGFPSSSSSALQWGVGLKWVANKKMSFAGEITMFTADSDTYQTFSLAGQYIL